MKLQAIIKGDSPFYCDLYKSRKMKLVRPGQVVFVSHSILSRRPPFGRQEGGKYCCELQIVNATPWDNWEGKVELFEDDLELQEVSK